MKRSSLRAIPSVDKVLRELGDVEIPRAAVVALVRRQLNAIRQSQERLDSNQILARLRESLDSLRRSKIQPVINGTGILVHTNLGRSPLGDDVVRTLTSIASNYNNLEYDLTGGQRGGRAAYLEHNLAVLCGAEAATVVNNCAAALVLILRHFVSESRPNVVISRGELVQIGGGFRIPEILQASGATLREIGTTNKTSLSDYSRAITKQTALVLKVHRSNFFMGGFVDSPETHDIAQLAKQKRVPFVEDLGSGATIRTEAIAGIEHEPTPAEVLKQGVDLVTFSGDKLLGGPQAGIIAGKARLVAALKRDPFFRALRCDKLILSALQTTVDLHLNLHLNVTEAPGQNANDSGIPIIEMLRMSNETRQQRARAIIHELSGLSLTATIGAGKAQIGGGTLPRSIIPSVTVDLLPTNIGLEEFAARLRAATPPVIGYIAAGRFKLDLRTISPRQDAEVIGAVKSALNQPQMNTDGHG